MISNTVGNNTIDATYEIDACLKSSTLWGYVKKLQLTTNVSIALLNDPSAEVFINQLLTFGNGRVPVDTSNGLISFPANFRNFFSTKEEFINKLPNIIANHENYDWLSVILTTKNKDVDYLNSTVQNQIQPTIQLSL